MSKSEQGFAWVCQTCWRLYTTRDTIVRDDRKLRHGGGCKGHQARRVAIDSDGFPLAGELAPEERVIGPAPLSCRPPASLAAQPVFAPPPAPLFPLTQYPPPPAPLFPRTQYPSPPAPPSPPPPPPPPAPSAFPSAPYLVLIPFLLL